MLLCYMGIREPSEHQSDTIPDGPCSLRAARLAPCTPRASKPVHWENPSSVWHLEEAAAHAALACQDGVCGDDDVMLLQERDAAIPVWTMIRIHLQGASHRGEDAEHSAFSVEGRQAPTESCTMWPCLPKKPLSSNTPATPDRPAINYPICMRTPTLIALWERTTAYRH